MVYNDLNLSATRDAGEAGIDTVTVNLYDSTNTLIATKITGVNGTYSFINLSPGSYRVVETDAVGYISSTSNLISITVAPGVTSVVDFGDYRLVNTASVSVSGTVWNDANSDGVINPSESILSGVTINLKNSLSLIVATATTNASGAYSFAGLIPGTYTVVETDPAGYISTTLNAVSTTLSAGSAVTINFGDKTGNPVTADPAVTKNGSPNSAIVGDVVVYTITVGNNGTGNATNVVLTDTKPSFLDILSITISPNPGLTPAIVGNSFSISFGTVAPTDVFTVTVVTRVNTLGAPPGGSNHASLTTTSSTDLAFNNSASAPLQILAGGNGGTHTQGLSHTTTLLPATGFSQNKVTILPFQPVDKIYASTDLWLEIPKLGVKISIVGVPESKEGWDVTWLGKDAGWLNGSAYPTWNGNSILTGHVWDALNKPGPFAQLKSLKYGDQVKIHAFGMIYTYAITENSLITNTDVKTVFKHEDKSVITLITCESYKEITNTYAYHRMARAILVSVTPEK